MSCLTVGQVLTHCISIESRNALRRTQVLPAGFDIESRHCPYAPGRSHEAQLWHDVLPGPENKPVAQALQVEAPVTLKVPLGHMEHPMPWPRV